MLLKKLNNEATILAVFITLLIDDSSQAVVFREIRRPDGSSAYSNYKKAKIFNTFFAIVFTADNGRDQHFPA